MNGVIEVESDDFEFVEVDPTGRYGRFDEILGKGASKTVYRGFDEYEGIEVAWNQVKLYDFMKSSDDLERLYCEIHLLKTLKHKNIMKFYTSWVDVSNRNINFVTEMFTSGTLRQYRLKHKRVNIRAVKLWCRQILEGLCYLHSRDPPVIHRDLKCDNIFINGNQGEVKIGDLGLAAILRKSHVARCVGTPEFMAPEVYTEEYNELVDIYSFGMCILEMMTFEYPYSECSHPAQIYKKVISGKKPEALYKVKDPEVRQFVEKCLATVSHRLSARELLNDPFLHVDDYTTSDFRSLSCAEDYETWPMLKQPLLNHHHHSINSDYVEFGHDDDLDHHANEVDLFTSEDDDDDDRWENADISIKGRRRGDDSIFLRLRITDKEGHVRNIYFPFDTETDTALSVATEMVAELDITDQDVSKIAEMIDTEIASLVPSWKRSPIMEEHLDYANNGCYHKCASEGHLVDYLSSHGPGSRNLQVIKSSRHGWGTLQGRFEEITFQFDGSEQCNTENAPDSSCESDGIHWAEYDKLKLTPRDSCDYHLDEQERLTFDTNARIADIDKENKCYENEIRQELSWLKAKYETQLTEQVEKKCARIYKKTAYGFCSPEHMVTAKSFYTPLHRATSLPVDAMDV